MICDDVRFNFTVLDSLCFVSFYLFCFVWFCFSVFGRPCCNRQEARVVNIFLFSVTWVSQGIGSLRRRHRVNFSIFQPEARSLLKICDVGGSLQPGGVEQIRKRSVVVR